MLRLRLSHLVLIIINQKGNKIIDNNQLNKSGLTDNNPLGRGRTTSRGNLKN